jgi:hypothetical protein
MTPEEYQRIKEAEKEHLRALKKLKKAVRDLERSKSIAHSVTRMSSTSQTALETHEEMVDKLALETAQYEARLEVALESAGEKSHEADRIEQLQTADEELQQERARGLVEQLRSEMAVTETPPAEDERPARSQREPTAEAGEETPEAPLPDKTIGRMRRE